MFDDKGTAKSNLGKDAEEETINDSSFNKWLIFGITVIGILIVSTVVNNAGGVESIFESSGGDLSNDNVPATENNNSNDNADDNKNINVGYTEIYYPTAEIPDVIRLMDGEGSNALILTIEDIEIENEIISFNMVYHRQKIGSYPKLTVRVDYSAPEAPGIVFKKEFRTDTDTFQIGEKRFQEFGELFSISRKNVGAEPAKIIRIRIDGI